MVDALIIRKVVGIIGNVISFMLFLSPVPTFVKIWKKKAVEDFSPIPYIATLLNCALWILYGLPFVTSNNTLVWTINGTGFLLESIYIIIFFVFSPKKLKAVVMKYLAAGVVFMVVVALCVVLAIHTSDKCKLVVGILALIFNLGMYAAPFSVMKLVIQTKSVEYMPFSLSLMSTLNGACWLAYALLKFDIFILIPNGLGGLMGIFQLLLYFYYYFKSQKEAPKPGDIEMSRNSHASV